MHDLKKFHVYEGLKESINSYINFYNNKKLQERFKNITPPESTLYSFRYSQGTNSVSYKRRYTYSRVFR